jgi:hypothetical protein
MWVSSARTVADSGTSSPVTVTATCPSGHVVLGGGYALSGGVNVERAAVIEDFPTSVTTWTVTANGATGGGPLTLTVYAGCLLEGGPVTTQMIVSTPTVPNDGSLHTFVAPCPVGTTVTGGGYRDGGFNGSPTEDGWQVTYIPRGENPPPTVRVFAICASQQVHVGVIATATQAVAVGGRATLAIACPAGELLVGGGYRYDGAPSTAYVNEPASDFASWQVEILDQGIAGAAGYPGTLTANAVCVWTAPPSAGS